MSLISLDDLIPQPSEWRAEHGEWKHQNFELATPYAASSRLLSSPPFAIAGGQLLAVTLAGDFDGIADFAFGVEHLSGRLFLGSRTPEIVHSRLFQDITGVRRLSLAFRPAKSGRYRLFLELSSGDPLGARIAIREPRLLAQGLGEGRVRKVPLATQTPADMGDPYLPQWGAVKRYLHRRCRKSRGFNNLVSAIEMRLGCEEVVSLPQYMALCPTGQCNALCNFCSVTINRTGIVKKQLPFAQLDRFLEPAANTVQLYGIEGNGEPTLYAWFPELVDRLTRSRAGAYLITNGSRLKDNDLPLLLALESVNFSLNAATAETHRRVMKLDNFEQITNIIRRLCRERGRKGPVSDPTPKIYVSFVVTRENVGEVQDFLRLAEQDLQVDVILVRPLSELGNDIGTTEDMRDIVPFESDIRDMVDAVADYMADVPRRAEIRIAPHSFASFRPDPIGRVQMPRGFEGRLLAPRRDAWHLLHPKASVEWHVNRARLTLPAIHGDVVRTDLIDIEPTTELLFSAKVAVTGGPLKLSVVDDRGSVVGTALLYDTFNRNCSIHLRPNGASQLAFVFTCYGRAAKVDIDFHRLRTPAPYISAAFRIPKSNRWELCCADASVTWSGHSLSLTAPRGGGPYVLKSYGISCGRHQVIELPLLVDVRRGSVTVGVLDAMGTSFLEAGDFAVGHSSCSLFFYTGDNETVRLVVSAEPGIHTDATILWPEQPVEDGVVAEPEPSRGLPDAAKWRECIGGVMVGKQPDHLRLSWQGGGSSYLAKSNKFWCGPNQRVELPVALRVSEGKVAVGVLDPTESTWLDNQVFGEGSHATTLRFETGSDGRVSAVISAIDGCPAEIDLDLPREPIHAHPGPVAARVFSVPVATLPIEVETAGPPASPDPTPASSSAARASEPNDADLPAAFELAGETEPLSTWQKNPPPLPSLWRRICRAFAPGTRYSCQKPWTDLNNFSVDGRFDVCCIATGPSQSRYQLGNLHKHTFQQIWNGPTAREFRRTVNSDNPLPPCVRCPMLRAYQGLWFDANFTRDYVATRILELTKGTRPGKALASGAARLAMLAFHGFEAERIDPARGASRRVRRGLRRRLEL